MKNISFIIIFQLTVLSGYCQKFKSGYEIFQIMENSKISYEISPLEYSIECKDYSDNLTLNHYYRVTTDSGLSTFKIVISDKVKPILDRAEFYFEIDYIDSALYNYKLAVQEDSTLFNIMTYIGQSYWIKKDYKESMNWYKLVIQKNYIDYMAHWFLADAYLMHNQIDEAVDEITIAMILNRNNPRIKTSFMNIYSKANRDTTDWCFNPQVEITKESDDKISIRYSEKWIAYALAKAIWLYEPGYRESMGVKSEVYSPIEDRECLLALLNGLYNLKVDFLNDTQLRILDDALKNEFFNEYIFYEILLRQHPYIAFKLPEKSILDIKKYILTIRNPKKN